MASNGLVIPLRAAAEDAAEPESKPAHGHVLDRAFGLILALLLGL
jgi:hypothetical protein